MAQNSSSEETCSLPENEGSENRDEERHIGVDRVVATSMCSGAATGAAINPPSQTHQLKKQEITLNVLVNVNNDGSTTHEVKPDHAPPTPIDDHQSQSLETHLEDGAFDVVDGAVGVGLPEEEQRLSELKPYHYVSNEHQVEEQNSLHRDSSDLSIDGAGLAAGQQHRSAPLTSPHSVSNDLSPVHRPSDYYGSEEHSSCYDSYKTPVQVQDHEDPC